MVDSAIRHVYSVCPYCGVGCGLELVVERNKVVRVLPQHNHPVSKGKLCIKGATVDRMIHSPERLKWPLMKDKKTGKFVKTSWPNALNTIAKKFEEIKETYGSNAIGIIASTKCTNEESYVLQKFARVCIGTNNIDNSTRLCHAPTVYGLYEVFGRSAMTNSYNDLCESDCIIVFGDNPAVTQPVAFENILACKKHSSKLIVVDVRLTETAEKADEFVCIKPNTDLLLIAGMLKVIIKAGLEDRTFIRRRTRGYDEFLKSLEKFDLHSIERATGVDVQKLKEIALAYGKAKAAAIIFGMGITQQSNGMETVQALADLALATGNFGRVGTGINPLRGCNNVQGCCDVGCLPNVYPGYASLTQENIAKFMELWHAESLPASKGLSITEMVEGIPERILAMYIVGQNPLLSLPALERVSKNLKNLEFLVVEEIFLTEIAELADVVLPAACFAEKAGTVTNSERRIQLLHKAVTPPGEAMEDWRIVVELAKRMGYEQQFNYSSAEQIFNEMRTCISTYAGATYSKLKRGGLQWPVNSKHPKGKPILYDKDFGPKGNRAVFYPLSYIGPQVFDHVYPFTLISYRILEQYNCGSMTRRVHQLDRLKPKPFAELHPADARRLRIKDGERVKLISPFGEIKLRARLSDRCSRGIVAVPNHYVEARPNKLIPCILDPVSKIPALKYCNVRIEKG